VQELQLTCYSSDYSDVPVKIIVGSKDYHIHPKLLSKDSPFWADKIQNAVGGEIHLPDVTPDVFSVFLEWLVFIPGARPRPKLN
jgi:hypothetical protein